MLKYEQDFSYSGGVDTWSLKHGQTFHPHSKKQNKQKTILIKKSPQGILTTSMLAYLLMNNTFVYDACMDDKSDMKFQLHRFYLEQYFFDKYIIKLSGFMLALFFIYFS